MDGQVEPLGIRLEFQGHENGGHVICILQDSLGGDALVIIPLPEEVEGDYWFDQGRAAFADGGRAHWSETAKEFADVMEQDINEYQALLLTAAGVLCASAVNEPDEAFRPYNLRLDRKTVAALAECVKQTRYAELLDQLADEQHT